MAWGLARISSRELSEWMAYYSLEPFGAVRGDLQAAIVASTVANSAGANTKPADFIPDFEPAAEPEEPAWIQQLAFIQALNTALGGRDLRKGRDNVDSGDPGRSAGR